jgi:Flp pilus assembly protein TadB
MSWIFATILIFVAVLAGALVLSEWLVRRRYRRRDDDHSAMG